MLSFVNADTKLGAEDVGLTVAFAWRPNHQKLTNMTRFLRRSDRAVGQLLRTGPSLKRVRHNQNSIKTPPGFQPAIKTHFQTAKISEFRCSKEWLMNLTQCLKINSRTTRFRKRHMVPFWNDIGTVQTSFMWAFTRFCRGQSQEKKDFTHDFAREQTSSVSTVSTRLEKSRGGLP